MHLSPTEIEKLTRSILRQLNESGLKPFDMAKGEAVIATVIKDDLEEERRIEAEAMVLLKQHKTAMGAGLDQEKALRMIKQKLADQKGFVL